MVVGNCPRRCNLGGYCDVLHDNLESRGCHVDLTEGVQRGRQVRSSLRLPASDGYYAARGWLPVYLYPLAFHYWPASFCLTAAGVSWQLGEATSSTTLFSLVPGCRLHNNLVPGWGIN